jgi:hypothetical protein
MEARSVCGLSPVTAPTAQLEDPTYSTEAIDRESSVVWVRSSSCGSEY